MTKKTKQPRDWKCQECGHRMTLRQAERCAFGDGCPECGGSDIDLVETEEALTRHAERQARMQRSPTNNLDSQADRNESVRRLCAVLAGGTYGALIYTGGQS